MHSARLDKCQSQLPLITHLHLIYHNTPYLIRIGLATQESLKARLAYRQQPIVMLQLTGIRVDRRVDIVQVSPKQIRSLVLIVPVCGLDR